MAKLAIKSYLSLYCLSGSLRKSNETMRLIVTTVIGVVVGFLIGISFPTNNLAKVRRFVSYLYPFWAYYLAFLLNEGIM